MYQEATFYFGGVCADENPLMQMSGFSTHDSLFRIESVNRAASRVLIASARPVTEEDRKVAPPFEYAFVPAVLTGLFVDHPKIANSNGAMITKSGERVNRSFCGNISMFYIFPCQLFSLISTTDTLQKDFEPHASASVTYDVDFLNT